MNLAKRVIIIFLFEVASQTCPHVPPHNIPTPFCGGIEGFLKHSLFWVLGIIMDPKTESAPTTDPDYKLKLKLCVVVPIHFPKMLTFGK